MHAKLVDALGAEALSIYVRSLRNRPAQSLFNGGLRGAVGAFRHPSSVRSHDPLGGTPGLVHRSVLFQEHCQAPAGERSVSEAGAPRADVVSVTAEPLAGSQDLLLF